MTVLEYRNILQAQRSGIYGCRRQTQFMQGNLLNTRTLWPYPLQLLGPPIFKPIMKCSCRPSNWQLSTLNCYISCAGRIVHYMFCRTLSKIQPGWKNYRFISKCRPKINYSWRLVHKTKQYWISATFFQAYRLVNNLRDYTYYFIMDTSIAELCVRSSVMIVAPTSWHVEIQASVLGATRCQATGVYMRTAEWYKTRLENQF